MASGNSEEGKGMLLRNGDDRIRLPSPQRGTPDTSSTWVFKMNLISVAPYGCIRSYQKRKFSLTVSDCLWKSK